MQVEKIAENLERHTSWLAKVYFGLQLHVGSTNSLTWSLRCNLTDELQRCGIWEKS